MSVKLTTPDRRPEIVAPGIVAAVTAVLMLGIEELL
jgi:hypothetical protein